MKNSAFEAANAIAPLWHQMLELKPNSRTLRQEAENKMIEIFICLSCEK